MRLRKFSRESKVGESKVGIGFDNLYCIRLRKYSEWLTPKVGGKAACGLGSIGLPKYSEWLTPKVGGKAACGLGSIELRKYPE
jgi:hypothetical protein